MDLLWDTLGFAAKGFVVFAVIAASTAVIVALVRRRRFSRGNLEVLRLNDRYEALSNGLRAMAMEPREFKRLLKARHEEQKKAGRRPSVFVLDFDGDLFATSVASLRDEVSAILGAAREGDEVVLRLESPGGGVPHYGLAAAQLVRLKDKKLKVTVCVDRVAASGGYLMACVAHSIVAAPFAVVGSIGVAAEVPNLHRLLKKHDVDFHEMTAGEFKRTVSVFGEITDKGRAKFQEQLEETHGLFKEFLKSQRPGLDVAHVATGEYWLGQKAKALGLVDALGTSDDYLLSRVGDANVFEVHYEPVESWRERLEHLGVSVAERALLRLWSRLQAHTLQ